MGAWIETLGMLLPCYVRESHPTWVRGLKPIGKNLPDIKVTSHPTWVRGLKREVVAVLGNVCHVAPYVGAWIETFCHND